MLILGLQFSLLLVKYLVSYQTFFYRNQLNELDKNKLLKITEEEIELSENEKEKTEIILEEEKEETENL